MIQPLLEKRKMYIYDTTLIPTENINLKSVSSFPEISSTFVSQKKITNLQK